MSGSVTTMSVGSGLRPGGLFRAVSILIWAGAGLVLAGCGKSDGGAGPASPGDKTGPSTSPGAQIKSITGRKPVVVATTGMIGDLVRQVAGDAVDLTVLMGPKVDPHTYRPTKSDIGALGKADLIVCNGLHLEGKMGEVLDGMAKSRAVLTLGDVVPAERLRKPAGEPHPDPHIWFDASLWSTCVDPVAGALGKLLPERASDFAGKAAAYRKALAELHEWAGKELATIDPSRRVLVTAHDAFEYFAAAYNLEVHALQGVSTETDFGPADVQRLGDLLVGRKIKAVFPESSVAPSSIEALRRHCEGRGHTVTVGGELFSDALDRSDRPAGTYAGMFRHNVDAIVAALK